MGIHFFRRSCKDGLFPFSNSGLLYWIRMHLNNAINSFFVEGWIIFNRFVLLIYHQSFWWEYLRIDCCFLPPLTILFLWRCWSFHVFPLVAPFLSTYWILNFHSICESAIVSKCCITVSAMNLESGDPMMFLWFADIFVH